MRTLLVVSTLLALLLALGACSVKLGPSSDQPAAGPTPSAEKPPAETPAETPDKPPAAETKAKVALIQVGDKFDADKTRVTNITKTFKATTPTIYVVAGLRGLEKGQKIGGRLEAVEVTTADGTVYREEEVAATELESPGSEATVHFDFTPPKGGWPVGSYQAEVSVEGVVVETIELTVQ